MINLLFGCNARYWVHLIFPLLIFATSLAYSTEYDYWQAGDGTASWPYGYGKDAVTACRDQQQKTGGWYAQIVLTQCKAVPGDGWNGCAAANGWNNNVPCNGKYCREGQFWVGPQDQCCPIGNKVNPQTGQCEGVIDDKNEPPDPCKKTSAPVNFTTGNKTIEEVDLDPGTNNQKLQFIRTWNSYNQQWSFSYRSFMILDSDHVTLHRDNGEVVRFIRDSSRFVAAGPDVTAGLYPQGAGFLYVPAAGPKEYYNSATKRLAYFINEEGKTAFVYNTDATTVKITVTDRPGIELKLDDKGQVIGMTDPDGKVYRYKYRADGALQYVSFPDTTPNMSGSNPFGEDNPYQTYHYDHAANNKLITSITDANGDLYKTIVYDEKGRALSSGFADGSLDGSTMDYSFLDDDSDPRVTVTNALGKDTVYHLDILYGVKKITQIEGVGTAECLADVQSRTYYPENGWLENSYDKAGVKTHYEYFTGYGSDVSQPHVGQLKTVTVAEGTVDEQVFHYDWTHTGANANVPLQVELVDRWRRDFEYSVPSDQPLAITDTDLTAGATPYSTQGRTRQWEYRYQDYSDRSRLVTEYGPKFLAPLRYLRSPGIFIHGKDI